ncbi:uncharacterized protein TRIADDRAFT_52867 [Trichoplax adhaerens]|uniref:Uncharacterized protein n=1 Tax=Trichoplax adhaerens TaxID=10228 RepID=B3RMN6_TRIAD|nr:predicted protein [Trichoplax adhaerens]EDV27883.1 predicted protein [Trichoplax adhaerens]|eukprot:XP_002109717.1 predicted protein [Trichoplax adhaerens]
MKAVKSISLPFPILLLVISQILKAYSLCQIKDSKTLAYTNDELVRKMLQRNRPCYWRNYMVCKEEGYFLFHTSDDFASLLCALPQYLLTAGQTPVHIASVFNCSVKDERLQPPDITRNVTEYLLARLLNIQNINNKKEFYACSFYSGQCSKNVLDKIIVVPPRNDLALIYVEIIFYIVAAAIVFKLFLLILRPPSRSTLTDVTTIEGQQVICLYQVFDTADAVKLFIYRCIPKKKCYQILLLHFILLLGGMIPFLCSIFNIQKFRYIYTHLDLSTLLMILLYWLPSLVIFLIINLLLGMIVTVVAITLTRNKIARGCVNYVKASNDWFATFVDQGFFYKIVHWFQLHIFIFVITFKANEFNIKSSRWYRYFLIIYFTMSLGLLCYELTNLCSSILANIIIGVVHPSGMLPLLATQLPFVVTLIALIQRHFNRKQYILGLFNELNAKDIPVCIETYRSDNQILVEVSPDANQFIHQIQDFFQQETFHKTCVQTLFYI